MRAVGAEEEELGESGERRADAEEEEEGWGEELEVALEDLADEEGEADEEEAGEGEDGGVGEGGEEAWFEGAGAPNIGDGAAAEIGAIGGGGWGGKGEGGDGLGGRV